MKAVFNFTVVETESIPETLQNRAFQYGDGLFETMVFQNGNINFLEDHMQRLLKGMEALHMKIPERLSTTDLQEVIAHLCKVLHLEKARIRLQVWRKTGGLYTPQSNEVDLLVVAQPLVIPVVSIKNQVVFYDDIRLHHSTISCFKTSSALPYVMAGLYRKENNADDVVLMDVYGHVAECVASNLFWIKHDILYTPSLESGCIAGVIRKNVIRQAYSIFSSVQEGLFAREKLLQAEVVFSCNVAGIQLIREINGVSFCVDTPLKEWLQSILQ